MNEERAPKGASEPGASVAPGPPWPEREVHEIVEHLQTAALELIAAARAFLDLTEEMVRDPAEAIALASALAAKVPPPGPPKGAGDPDDVARVERIRVS